MPANDKGDKTMVPPLDAAGRRRRRLLLAAAGLCAASPALRAQPAAYPARPIQFLVAAPPGGPSDALARMFAEAMREPLGQPWIVDNRAGAGGAIAAQAVARAPADGYTLMLSWIGNATNQTLVPGQGFDINRDFVHITELLAGFNVLVARPGLGVHSVRELLALARARPGTLSFASAGNGSSGHLALELFKQRAGLSVVHVPYRGGAPAMNDLLGGQVDAMFINQDAIIPYLRSGRLVPLAITSVVRLARFPELPTLAESGLPGFEATAWAGLSAPRGTPDAVVERLHAAAVRALSGPMRARQEALGAEIIGSTPAQYSAFVRSETEKWAKVIRTAGIRLG